MRYLVALVGFTLLAADEPKKEPPKAPVVSSELQTKFWQRMYDNDQAQKQAKEALDSLQQVNLEIVAACGEGFNPLIDYNQAAKVKIISCAPKPAPEKKPDPAK